MALFILLHIKMLKNMKGILCLFFLLVSLFALSQTKEQDLPLRFHEGNGPFEYALPAIKWNDTLIASKNIYPEFKNIPSNLKGIKRGRIYFDLSQYLFQNYVAGKLSKKDFEKIKNNSRIKFNESLLVKKEIKCYVNIISATNKKNETVCIVDANNNYDFSDDDLFIPLNDSLPDQELNRHLVNVMCQRVLNEKIINDKTPLLIAKDGSVLGFSIAQYATATLNIKGKKYVLAVCPFYFSSRTWNESQMVLLTDSLKTKKANQDLIVDNGGFITIGSQIYKFNGVDFTKNLLSLQKMSSIVQYSSQVGYQAPLFKSENLLTGKEISLASLKGKYILIDFWGTWCHPCREQIPELIKLNNIVDSSQFVLISIASSETLENLKKVIAKENMVWPQLFSDKITEQYHINAFPTSFLISPKGIIIEKDLSIDDLKEKLSKLELMKRE